MKTLDREEVDGSTYRDVVDALRPDRNLHRGRLQPPAAPLGTRLPAARGVRRNIAEIAVAILPPSISITQNCP
jgi:hypothetical protein